jgi:hypothetical protein
MQNEKLSNLWSSPNILIRLGNEAVESCSTHGREKEGIENFNLELST